MNKSVDPYLLQNWYSLIEDETSPTVMLALNRPTAVAMLKACEQRRNKGLVSEEQLALLEHLKARMREVMEARGGCFVKLSARSCKDSILRSAHFKRVLQAEVELLEPPVTPNDILCCYVRAQCFAMKRESGEDALEDMLESRRIYEDLTLATLEKEFNMEIVFREWDDELVPEREIRCYIFGKKVTAMTQYYSSLFVPKLSESKAELGEQVRAYCTSLIERIGLQDFTLDVGIRKDGSFSVVEINPPAPRSGTSLFTWNFSNRSEEEESPADHDRLIIQGKRPFEFRVLSAPIENIATQRQKTFDHLKALGYDWKEAEDGKCVLF